MATLDVAMPKRREDTYCKQTHAHVSVSMAPELLQLTKH